MNDKMRTAHGFVIATLVAQKHFSLAKIFFTYFPLLDVFQASLDDGDLAPGLVLGELFLSLPYPQKI